MGISHEKWIIHTSGEEIFFYFASILYCLVWYPPGDWLEIAFWHTAFWVLKAASFLVLFLYMFVKKMKWNKYWTLLGLISVSVLISGLQNPEGTMDTTRAVVRIIAIPLYIKVTVESDRKVLNSAVRGMALYFFLVCLANTIQILLVGGQAFGHYFFLGSDNGVANTYLMSVFLLYIRKMLLYIKRSAMLYVAVINLIIYGLVLEVGAVKLCILGGAILYILYRTLNKKTYQTVFCLRNLLLVHLVLCMLMLLGQFSIFKNIVNQLFFGKFESILSRMVLWEYFLTKSLQKPFFGYGAALSKYNSMPEGFAKWTLSGNCHNCYIEIIYHYGFITFFLILFLLFWLAYKLKKRRSKETILGIFLFLFLLHGLVEGGINYIYPYLTFLYYSDRLHDTRGLL